MQSNNFKNIGREEISNEEILPKDEYSILSFNIDREFYKGQVEALEGVADLVLHYHQIGWLEGLDPHPEFSTNYYLACNEDVKVAAINPYLHYLQWGKREGRAPNETVAHNIELYVDLGPDIKLIRLNIDREYYIEQHPHLATNNADPSCHYYYFGWKTGTNPSRDFDTNFYLDRNKDVQISGVNPFVHYLKWGKPEGRRGRLSSKEDRYYIGSNQQFPKELFKGFDAEYYLTNVGNFDDKDLDPLLHYHNFGWRQGLNPNNTFSTEFYCASQADAPFEGGNPLFDYNIKGFSQGRIPAPVHPVLQTSNKNARQAWQRKLISKYFDVEFYRNSYSDLRDAKVDFVQHYISFGHQEGRNPTPWFSTDFYLRTYPQVALYDIDPLTHYAIWGEANGFRTHPNISRGTPPIIEGTPSAIKDGMLVDALRDFGVSTAKPSNVYERKSLKIHWVIPNYGVGGGGHMTIFRTIHWLEYFGHECTIWVSGENDFNVSDAYERILKYYQFVKADVKLLSKDLVNSIGDIVFATSWDTAFIVESCSGFKERFYFVQDYEPAFYARGSRGVLAEETYNLDLNCICASPWLKHVLETKHSRWARDFYLSYDKDFYYPAQQLDRANDVPRIAVYSRIGTERRCVELAIIALEDLARRGFKFHADIFGTDTPFANLSFPHSFHDVMPSEELGRLYRECDVGVCFSATNYSLVPQEMMACGLPVIELNVESARFSIGEGAALMTSPLPSKIADSIVHLIDNPEDRFALAERGMQWAAQHTWEAAARSVEAALLERLMEKGWQERVLAAPAIIGPEPVKASIIVPTLNGGKIFAEVLDRIAEQKMTEPYELVVIDSGSTDDTLNDVRKYPFSRILEIPKKEFQHGRTRNVAASHAKGEYLVFITQDAIPADTFWLYNFVNAMDVYPEAQGAFGRHIAHRDASYFTRAEIRDHFQGFNSFPLLMSKYTDIQKWNQNDRGWHQLLHFYSDNNSCMRREAWNKLPYAEIDYGEDQLWAYEAMKQGWGKLYCPNAVVYHSHDYGYEETMERAEVESWFFKKYFGYDLSVNDIESHVSQRNMKTEIDYALHSLDREEVEIRKRNNVAQLLGWELGARRDD